MILSRDYRSNNSTKTSDTFYLFNLSNGKHTYTQYANLGVCVPSLKKRQENFRSTGDLKTFDWLFRRLENTDFSRKIKTHLNRHLQFHFFFFVFLSYHSSLLLSLPGLPNILLDTKKYEKVSVKYLCNILKEKKNLKVQN